MVCLSPSLTLTTLEWLLLKKIVKAHMPDEFFKGYTTFSVSVHGETCHASPATQNTMLLIATV